MCLVYVKDTAHSGQYILKKPMKFMTYTHTRKERYLKKRPVPIKLLCRENIMHEKREKFKIVG